MKLTTFAIATAFSSAALLGGLAAPASAGPAECPPGWDLQFVPPGSIYDKNNDGRICTKDVPGEGDGNSANSQRNPGQTGFHTDGHNHKDNNPPS